VNIARRSERWAADDLAALRALVAYLNELEKVSQ
jgi:hypothetical protein